MKNKMHLSLSLATILIPFSLLNAEEIKDIDLGESIVSASGFKQAIQEAPATISVITNKDLSSKAYKDIAEAISDIPGVDLNASRGNTGAYRITMRGITGYTLILVDGRRQTVGGNIGPNGFDDAQITFLPPLASIERIEVIKGPMSTLYGSDALGGVINIITKKVTNEWHSNIQLESILNENTQWGNYYGGTFYTSGPIIKDKLGITLRLREYFRDASNVVFRQSNGSIVAPTRGRAQSPTKANLHNIGAKLTYLPDELNTLTLDFDYGLNRYDNKKGQLGTITRPSNNGGLDGGYTDSMDIQRIITYITHQGHYDYFSIDSGIQYNAISNDGREVVGQSGIPHLGQNRDILAETYIGNTKAVIPIGNSNILSVGGEYKLEKMQDKIANPTNFSQYLLAIFAENEYSILDNLRLTTGVRYNYHQNFKSNISPRIYLVYNVLDNLTIKGGVATGFKAPEANQLIPGEFNYMGQGTLPVFGNPNLKEETSINYEASIAYDNGSFYVGLTGYLTDFKDKLSTTDIANGQPVPGTGRICNSMSNGMGTNICRQQINHGEVQYRGLEFSIGGIPIDDLKLDFWYTYGSSEVKKSFDLLAIGKPETDTLSHNINAKISYTIYSITSYLKGEYQIGRYRSPSEYNIASKFYKDVFLLSLGLSYDINKYWSINGGIYNLLDMDFTKDFIQNGNTYLNAFNRVQEGRRYWISTSISF